MCATVRGHLAAMDRLAPRARELYRAAARREIALAIGRGELAADRAAELEAVLGEGSGIGRRRPSTCRGRRRDRPRPVHPDAWAARAHPPRGYHRHMQHGVDAIRGSRSHGRFVTPHPRSSQLAHGVAFLTVSGPWPGLAPVSRTQPVVAVHAAARRLGTIGALPVEQERPAMTGASGMCWSPARVALRDHRRRSASPWRG